MNGIIDKLKMPAEIQISCANKNLEFSSGRVKTTTFAQRLKLVIDHCAISMTAFAQRCKLSESAIRKYIGGDSEPTLHNLVVLSEVGNVPLCWLATGKMYHPRHATNKSNPPLSATTNNDYQVVHEVSFESLREEELEIIPNSQWTLSNIWLKKGSLDGKCLAVTALNGDNSIAKHSDPALISIKQQGYHDAMEGVFVILLQNHLLIKRIQFDPIKNGYIICSDNHFYRDSFVTLDDNLNFRIIAKIEYILRSAL